MLDILLNEVRRLGRSSIDAKAIDEEAAIPRPLLQKIGEIGLFGVTIPESWGGLGLSLGDACQIVAELAIYDRSVATTVGLHLGLGTRALIELGSDELRSRYLPEMASGERIGAFAATEASAGSDLTAIRTEATLDGEQLRLRGEKLYVTNGGFAGMVTVLAKTRGIDGRATSSLICVPTEAGAIARGPEEKKLGIRGSSTVSLRFEDVRLPRSYLLGAEGSGLKAAHRALEWGRSMMSAGCVGTARAALDRAVDHVKSRRQFGRAIGAFDAARSHIATMAARLYAMEAVIDRLGALESRGQPIVVESALAKVFCSEGVFDTTDRALQLHGAMGFVEDAGIARLARDCRVTRIFEGSNDVLLTQLGMAAAGRAPTFANVELPADTPENLARRVVELQAQLVRHTRQLERHYGVALVREQLLLERIGRAHMALWVASIVLSYPGHQPAVRSNDLRRQLAHKAAGLLLDEANTSFEKLGKGQLEAAENRALTDLIYDCALDVEPRRARSRRSTDFLAKGVAP